MIEDKDWIIPELLTKFKVLKVRWEPNSESEWTLQYQNYEPFRSDEKFFDTLEEDEQLIGKEIEAQISLSVEEFLPVIKKEKEVTYNEGWITTTGIYEDIIKTEVDGVTYDNYKLNSVFPLEISAIPEGANIGDWITVSGEADLILPRKRKEEFTRIDYY